MADWGPFDLAGKRVAVTGGAVGIGLGIGRCMVEAGALVLLADLDGEAAERAAASLEGRGKAIGMRADVVAEAEAIVERVVAEFGGLDVLVNNAGIYPMQPFMEMPDEVVDRVLDVNVKGLMRCSRAAARRMIGQGGGGSIVNIASIDSFRPSMVGLAAYDTSKGGVLMFTRSLALELAPHGIRVNGIAPGGIATPGTGGDNLPPDLVEQFTAAVPIKRFGTPEEIGTVAVFLASRAASYMTGETVVVDGGRLLA
jgi:2-deoxy-D-gluconate 3-dehydrogenase